MAQTISWLDPFTQFAFAPRIEEKLPTGEYILSCRGKLRELDKIDALSFGALPSEF